MLQKDYSKEKKKKTIKIRRSPSVRSFIPRRQITKQRETEIKTVMREDGRLVGGAARPRGSIKSSLIIYKDSFSRPVARRGRITPATITGPAIGPLEPLGAGGAEPLADFIFSLFRVRADSSALVLL